MQVLRCALDASTGRFAEARAACLVALKVDDEAAQAHFLLGKMAAMKGPSREAQFHLERAIALFPSARESWKLLEKQYQLAGKSRELKLLRDRELGQFMHVQ